MPVRSRRAESASFIMSATHRRKVPCTAYFVAQVDRPMDRFAGWQPGKDGGRELVPLPDGRISGIQTGAYLTFGKLKAGDQIQLKVALSYVSIEQARKNLAAEAHGWDFDAVVKAAAGVVDERGDGVLSLPQVGC